MKIMKKRAVAVLIDAFLCASLAVLITYWLKEFNFDIGGWSCVFVLFPWALKDILFRNASLGKKLVGIVIFDDKWQTPKLTVLIKRSLLLLTVGYWIFLKAKFFDGEIIRLFDWEKDVLSTRVIDKTVYKKIDEEAQKMSGEKSQNMTKLYNSYLQDLYLK